MIPLAAWRPDGGLILGLSVYEGEEQEYFEKLREHAGTQVGYIDHEAPPVDTVSEFWQVANERGHGVLWADRSVNHDIPES